MRITRLVRQKKHPNRLSVFLEGAFAFGIHDETALNHGLRAGLELDEGQITRMLQEENRKQAKDTAFHYLSFRPRTIREMQNKLREKEYDEAAVQETIALLERLGLLDDRDFAARWIAQRLRLKPRGRRVLFSELIHKGVARATAEETLSEAFLVTDERTLAADLLRKRAARYQDLDPSQASRKMGEFLARKGFPFDVARDVVAEIVRENGD
ncbi:MAG: RecX family transcriptional regulator [Candidatus Latescibacterota bacterium]